MARYQNARTIEGICLDRKQIGCKSVSSWRDFTFAAVASFVGVQAAVEDGRRTLKPRNTEVALVGSRSDNRTAERALSPS